MRGKRVTEGETWQRLGKFQHKKIKQKGETLELQQQKTKEIIHLVKIIS